MKIDSKNLNQNTEVIGFLTHYSSIPVFHGSGMSQELLKAP
jgi:hypothetical protein